MEFDPTTWSFTDGEVVPIPTLPLEFKYKISDPNVHEYMDKASTLLPIPDLICHCFAPAPPHVDVPVKKRIWAWLEPLTKIPPYGVDPLVFKNLAWT